MLVRPGRDRLAGLVEVDETFTAVRSRGGAAAGPARRCSPASRWRSGNRCRCRMRLADGRLHAFVTVTSSRARVITDGWQGYQGLELGYVHQRRSQRAARTRGEDPGELLPAVHRIASLTLLGTHQGSGHRAPDQLPE